MALPLPRRTPVGRRVLLLIALAVSVGVVAIVAPAHPVTALVVGGLAWLAYATWRLYDARRSSEHARAAETSPAAARQVHADHDPETGLFSAAALNEALQREIARSNRFGDKSVLVVLDSRVVNFRPSGDQPTPASPAPHIARVLQEEGRASDLICRLDLTRFAVLLTEATEPGASQFAERIRTAMSRRPYATNADGSGIWVRAWAGSATFDNSFDRPAQYLGAALGRLETQRAAYEYERSRFDGRAEAG
jgi:diguanylate cyclase (GGDEF)-like protein